jgi:hypothetical protein
MSKLPGNEVFEASNGHDSAFPRIEPTVEPENPSNPSNPENPVNLVNLANL